MPMALRASSRGRVARTMATAEPLLIEESTLCVLSDGTTWDRFAAAIELGFDWANQRRWQHQQLPFTLSGQRTLVVRCDKPPGDSNVAVKIKGHHFVLFEPTASPMLFRYGALQRPSLRPYSQLASAGPFL